MPIFEYACESCEQPFEFFHRSLNTEGDRVICTNCESEKVSKRISAFAINAPDVSESMASAPAPQACARPSGCACH